MKRRLLSLFLAFVTILSLLPTAAFAASSEEDALGEVDIYNGDYELGYLAINGAVKKQKYTYFLYESNDGSTKESPAYCVNPNQYGVPQTVGPGESIKYLANEKASDPKVVGIISNGYPHRSLGELGLENKYQAFYATKMALWCYLIPSWDISNLKVAPGLSGDELDRGNRILAAAKDIYKRGTTYNYILDHYYVWFKNNCPLSGPLYDDIRFEPLHGDRSGKYFVVIRDSPHEAHKWTLYTGRHGFEQPEFTCGNVRDMLRHINSMAPESWRGNPPPEKAMHPPQKKRKEAER